MKLRAIILSLLSFMAFGVFLSRPAVADSFYTVSGHVVDSSNQPMAGITVDIPYRESPSAVTDENGYYSFTMSEGDIRLRLSKNDTTSNWVLQLPETSLYSDLTMDFTVPMSTLSLHVYDPDGQPVSNTETQVSVNEALSVPVETSAGTQVAQVMGGPMVDAFTDDNGNVNATVVTDDPDHPYYVSVIPPNCWDGGVFQCLWNQTLDISTNTDASYAVLSN